MMLLKRKSVEVIASCRPARAKREDRQSHDDEPKRMAPCFAPVTLSELAGVRYLYLGTEWVQGAMQLSKPNAIELEYAQQMMAWLLLLDAITRADFHVVQLGPGAVALTRFYHRHLASVQVTAVELNPLVIIATHSMFGLPLNDACLSMFEQDACDWVTDTSHYGTADALQIGLYDATARGPMLDTPAFYKACRQVLRSSGMMTINLFGDHISFPRNIEHIYDVLGNRVFAFPEARDGNVIVLTFNGPSLQVSWEAMQVHVAALQAPFKLPTRGRVDGLRSANTGQEDALSI